MEKSSFKYWFFHWCAFQITAYKLNCWKPRFLFHDWEKPWLKLFLPYEKVRKFHRRNSRHHWESKYHRSNFDYEALVVDWECGRLTKPGETLDARGYFKLRFNEINEWDRYMINETLEKFGL